MNSLFKKDAFPGDTYCSWTVVEEFPKINTYNRPIKNLKIMCKCGYTRSIVKSDFLRNALLDKCPECIKCDKHERAV